MKPEIPFLRSPVILLALVLFFAFLPITSLQFAIKNDFFYSYFPAKYFLSESFQAREFPLWNPFINFGFPCYGDLSLSYWNFSTWLFAGIGYNAYSFTIEIILYLLLAGVGMYKLAGIWITNKESKLAAAIMYMCSGFIIGHLQHFNWINAAGILPFVIYSFWKLLNTQDRKYIFATIFSFSYYFTAVHPGHIIAAFYFFIGLTIFHFYRNKEIKQVLFKLLSISVGVIIILAGPLLAILDVLPYTNRSGPVASDQVLGVTDPGSWISFLLPLASTSDTYFLTNDISLRNCYIGLIPLAVLPLTLSKPKKPIVVFWLIIAFSYLVICTPWASSLYASIPLINTVRLPGEFRLFALLSLIVVSAIGLEQSHVSREKLATTFTFLSWMFAAILCAAFVYILSSRESLVFNLDFLTGTSFRGKLKAMVHSISFADKLFVQAALQLILARRYVKLFKDDNRFTLTQLVAFEFIIISLLNMPYTGVGKDSLAEVQKLIKKSPESIQQPYTTPESEIIKSYPYTDPVISNWGFYSKYPATREQMPYPLVLDRSSNYFGSGEHQKLLDKPFAFINSSGTVLPITNTYRSFSFQLALKSDDTLSIKQINFKGWKGQIDGKPVSLINNTNLIKLPVTAGSHTVDIYYENNVIIILFYLHFIAMGILAFCLLINASGTFYRNRY